LAMPVSLPNQVMGQLRRSVCQAHRSQKIGFAS